MTGRRRPTVGRISVKALIISIILLFRPIYNIVFCTVVVRGHATGAARSRVVVRHSRLAADRGNRIHRDGRAGGGRALVRRQVNKGEPVRPVGRPGGGGAAEAARTPVIIRHGWAG